MIINKNNKKIANIKYLADWNLYINKYNKKITLLSKPLKRYLEHCVNFKLSPNFKKTLEYEIFGYKQKNKIVIYKLDINLIVKLISKTLIKCNKITDAHKPINIIILPTYNNFIKKKMFGVSGLTYDNNIFLFVFLQDGWRKYLPKIIAHEYAHFLTLSKNKLETLRDYIIFEGIAENFQEKVLGGKNMPWTKTINTRKATLILKKISPHLNSTNQRYYSNIFLAWDKKYPFGSGYAIGYYIVKSFISNNKNLNWLELIKIGSNKIFKNSKFCSRIFK